MARTPFGKQVHFLHNFLGKKCGANKYGKVFSGEIANQVRCFYKVCQLPKNLADKKRPR